MILLLGKQGIHAREWVTPAAALYILHQVLDNLSSDDANSTFSGLNYYILPVVNPDGYEYSHTTDRFWRKNRSANNGSSCMGTDLNRNWNHKWAGPDSWSDPCHMNYRGAQPFSELETQAMSKYLLSKTGEIKGYMSLHSYGQNVLFPWAYSYTRPSDYKDLYDLAYYMAYKIKLENKAIYKFGGAAESYYIASGGSQDWAKAAAKIKYSYTLELRDTGEYMFSLPPSEIMKASKDAFAAFTVLTQKVKN
ncbi:carboxypeptidase B-like [Macrosteles quadrilineatus]|uniref:carboxypeptidase B-like n=1 Tax=Macrosteles quadrilineatus TaxID=74068 RepID=UPI0023E11688|nr:carboxypeptidase B-like [Macrosteles quadrilineatus]